MFSIWSAFVVSILYLTFLFAVASWGDVKQFSPRVRSMIYSLSLGAYCTSWAFYGVVAQASINGWWLAPTYAGSIMVFLLAIPVQQKIANICKQQNLTSIADFISSRYGHSRRLAGLVTVIAIIAVIPYIALQLKAMTNSVSVITGREHQASNSIFQDPSLYITLMMALFASLYGARRLRSSEHNPGLVLAIAFESLIKLIAFAAIGCFVVYGLYDGWGDLFQKAEVSAPIQHIKQTSSPLYVYFTHTLLGALAMFALPRQFHLGFIEQNQPRDLRFARFAFPGYLLLMSLFVLPVAYAGLMIFSDAQVNPDTYILALPMVHDAPVLTTLAYIGGLSAATSMVVITAVVLSVMVSNDLVTPFYLGRHSLLADKEALRPEALLTIRRFTIMVILLAAYLYHRVTTGAGSLANTGLISFSLVAQFAVPLLLGLFWKRANGRAAQLSLVVGMLAWFYCLLVPTMFKDQVVAGSWLYDGPFGITWLAPHSLFGLDMDFLSHGALVSLVANLLTFLCVALITKPSIAEKLNAKEFLQPAVASKAKEGIHSSSLTNKDIFDLLSRFIGREQSQKLLDTWLIGEEVEWLALAKRSLEEDAERELSGVIGGASAKLVMNAAREEKQLPFEQVVEFVDEASQVLLFNRELLQSTLENVSQGISVVDKELRLVAWNRRYLEMFDYPDGMLYVGRPVEDIIRYNAQRGIFGLQFDEAQIDKRISHLRNGSTYRYRRIHQDGTVYEMQGSPLPGGGFVTTFTDITDFIQTQQALEEARDNLERKVEVRTKALNEAREVAERATISKNRFFAAASHDLLQPFNAATLFCSLLREKTQETDLKELATHISNSLSNAEELLTSILELTKLDSGEFKTLITSFNLQDVTDDLAHQYQLFAQDKGLEFVYVRADVGIRSDKKLVRRILQNLLSNAVRYTFEGRVELRCNVYNGKVIIEVADTGVGISEDDKTKVFQEFHQSKDNRNENGLGLGLAITQRMCRILNHPLDFTSQQQLGSTFSISMPIDTQQQSPAKVTDSLTSSQDLKNLHIWVIDNDPQVLKAMTSLLTQWGCSHEEATSFKTLQTLLVDAEEGGLPDLVIADYQLDDGETGLTICSALLPENIPVIINSANNEDDLRDRVLEAGYQFLRKPVKAPALKRLIKRLTR